MTTYRFKPALLRAEQEYRLDQSALKTEDWELDLRHVSAVNYAETTVNYTTTRHLEMDANGQTYQVSQTTDASHLDDRAPFSTLVVAILRALGDLHPDLHVSFGLRKGARTGMFVVGMLSLLAGLALPVAALATGVSSNRFMAAAVPSAVLILLGLAFGWTNRPWQAPPRVPLSNLIASLNQVSDSQASPPS